MKTPKPLKPVRKAFEALLLCFGFVTIPFLPRRCIVWLSRVAASCAFACSRKQRSIALANVEIAFGNTFSESKKIDIVRESFRTSALMMLDILWFSVFTAKRVEKYVTCDPSVDEALLLSPLVLITGHFGNWEIAGLMTSLRGLSLLSVAAPIRNWGANVLINMARRKTGQSIALQTGAIKSVIRELRRGGRTALLMDQNTLPRKGGGFVDFFGLPVPMSKAAITICTRTGASMVFGYVIADEKGLYTVHSLPPVSVGESGVKEEEVLQMIAGWFEDAVKAHPGKWLWMYRRWRYVPEGADISRFPFYAKRLTPSG